MRYFIRLRYKGTHYHGWQFQTNALSIQGVVNEKLSQLLEENIETIGCGRTDAGVHAEEYYAHFDIDQDLDTEALLKALAELRVPGIEFRGIAKVDERLHARFSALNRSYEYRITRSLNPFLKGRSFYVHDLLDLDLLRKLSADLIGTHDFAAFTKVHSKNKTTICTITKAEWEVQGELLIFRISADRFLWNMVRAIVGTLLEIGLHKRPSDDLQRVMKSGKRINAGASVPAAGLFLTEVEYPKSSFKFV
jgi:tRNA pseudouridine38-40 synthase